MSYSFKHSSLFSLATVALLVLTTACGSKSTATVQETEEHHDEKGTVEMTEAQIKSAQIVLGTFEQKNLSEVITVNGYTKLPPQNQADVSVFITGIVKSIAITEGQPVKTGQTLATYQSLEYNNIRLQKAKLTEELQAANIHKTYLELDFTRQKELSDENVNAKKTFQKVSADLELEKSKIATLQQQIEILTQNLALGGSSNSGVIAIKAPISGFITAINIKIGSNVGPNTVLFSIVDNSKMHVDLLVYEKDFLKVKTGQQVRLVLTNQSNQEVIGTVFSIDKAFQNESKSVAVHAAINNRNTVLIPGMYVNALIDIGSSKMNTLPLEAIVRAEGKEFIFIQAEEPEHAEAEEETGHHAEEGLHFKRIEVKTGTTQLGYTQVSLLQDLPPNAKIVTKGAYYLQSSIANAEGGDDHGH